MSESNSGWQHQHLQSDFKACMKRQFQYGKSVFGLIAKEVDPLPAKETFQAGGTLQVVRGKLTFSVHGSTISDPSGLGRWCGMTFIGKESHKLSVITAYRTYKGSIQTAPLGSTFH